MKFSFAIIGLAAALTVPALGSAATLQYTFLNDVHGSSTGVDLGTTSHTFTDTHNDVESGITATVDPNFLNGYPTLYEKKGGGIENGLGITNDSLFFLSPFFSPFFSPSSDHEIEAYGSGIRLDFSNILAWHPSSISINLGSVQEGESGIISYGDGTSFTVTDNNTHLLNLSELYKSGSILVNAGCEGDVLIGGVTATTPEPATAGILGLGLLGVGALLRKRAKKA